MSEASEDNGIPGVRAQGGHLSQQQRGPLPTLSRTPCWLGEGFIYPALRVCLGSQLRSGARRDLMKEGQEDPQV